MDVYLLPVKEICKLQVTTENPRFRVLSGRHKILFYFFAAYKSRLRILLNAAGGVIGSLYIVWSG